MTRRRRPGEVYTITGASSSLHDDLGPRMRRYLISMSVRTVCFVLAVAVNGPMRWVFALAAVVLPYVAVVAANAGPRRSASQPGYTPPQRGLEGGQQDRLEP